MCQSQKYTFCSNNTISPPGRPGPVQLSSNYLFYLCHFYVPTREPPTFSNYSHGQAKPACLLAPKELFFWHQTDFIFGLRALKNIRKWQNFPQVFGSGQILSPKRMTLLLPYTSSLSQFPPHCYSTPLLLSNTKLLQFSKIMTLAKYIFSFRHFCL